MSKYKKPANHKNWEEQSKLGENAENILRLEAELAGRPIEMVNKIPGFYHLGDIHFLDKKKIIEVKGDYIVATTGNILFEESFKKPPEGIEITKYNKNVLNYITSPGWMLNGEYEKIVYYDMKCFQKFLINFPAAKAFIYANIDNGKIVRKMVDVLNEKENKLGTYYLVKHRVLSEEGILKYSYIHPLVLGWLKDHYDTNDFRLNWTMKNMHFNTY